MEKFDYWYKLQKKPDATDLEWNIPEQKSGIVSIIGGNSQNFSSIIRSAEFINQRFPIKQLNVILPESLRAKLPPMPNFLFCSATETGSFAESALLNQSAATSNFAVFLGDLSRNSATAVAIAKAIKSANEIPVLLTRDTIDLVLSEMNEIIENKQLFLVASLAQMQKLFRALYYPKVLLLSMPLLSVVEALHKFTLSYPTTILTFHQNQIIVAKDGEVYSMPIEITKYSPITLWSGDLAMKITALNLYNPGKPIEATLAAI